MTTGVGVKVDGLFVHTAIEQAAAIINSRPREVIERRGVCTSRHRTIQRGLVHAHESEAVAEVFAEEGSERVVVTGARSLGPEVCVFVDLHDLSFASAPNNADDEAPVVRAINAIAIPEKNHELRATPAARQKLQETSPPPGALRGRPALGER